MMPRPPRSTLFPYTTLGRSDVAQAARAFTGYTTDGQGRALYHPELHDDGDKTVLGQTGRWGAADMTDIVLDRHPEGPAAARLDRKSTRLNSSHANISYAVFC